MALSNKHLTQDMALLNKKEFAAICRTTIAVIDTNISRGNIIYLKEDKLVDSDDPINRGFFNRYEKLHKDKQSKEKLVQKIEADYDEVVEKVTEKVTKKEAATRVTESKKKSKVTNDWYERKLQADTLLQEARAEKEKGSPVRSTLTSHTHENTTWIFTVM